ncbi:MAG TPA: outer membrane lipoprotein-sorting protein [Terriglobia bacterium]|nr:outer membrane lipoprotein-sorting protein [Terriglobia bacterium]
MKLRTTACLFILFVFLASSNCSWFRVKQTHRIPASEQALPAKTASLEDLIQGVNQTAQKIQTLKLTVIYQLTGGSINTGEISNYRETDGFILARRPGWIRLIGLAFKVKVFDMVSDGKQFRIHVPPKNKFILGRNDEEIKGRKDVPINLRPQHIFQALIIDPVTAENDRDMRVLEEDQEGKHKYYVLSIIGPAKEGVGALIRKIWIDRFDLRLVRQKLYDSGRMVSDIAYREFKNFEGGDYPSVIDFTRPQEDYSLRIRISKAATNETLSDQQFVLEQPDGTEQVDLAENPK